MNTQAEAAAEPRSGEQRAQSGRWQRAPLIALAAAVLLLTAGVVLAVTSESAYKAQKIDEATVESRFLALIVSAALDFNDRAAAQKYVDALKANPEAEAAAIYDARGQLFASSRRDGAPPLPATPPQDGSDLAGNRLIVATPIVHDGVRLGTVYLDTLIEPVWRRLQRYVGIGLLVTLAALLVVGLGSAYAALTRANAELERRAVDLSDANRALYAQIEEREKAEEALRQSQKMEAIGRLTGGVAHDFNNLLTVVGGNLDLIERLADAGERRAVPKDRLGRLVEAAQRGLGRGARLTRQLLAFSRQEPLAAHSVEVNPMILDFAPLLQRALGETVELRLELGGERGWARLDPAQFEAAMLNLALNARDAMSGGGALTIVTRHTLPPDDGPAYIMLSVSDTGSGMSPEVQRRIFEPFFTTKPVGSGSGLGLAQVWAFATQSGGRVEVDSAPGAGTTFRLYLPLAPASAAAVDTERPGAVEEGGSETILVVEDEDDVREVAAATLERLGYRTIAARDGRDALAILNRSGDFDLLFTDYVMPNGLNGAQLAREAVRLRPRLKVLVTSGYARQGSASADNLRVDDFPMIAKPYRSADLAARIREILDAVEAEPSR